MQVFSDPHISIGSLPDITAIKVLLNSAYRGESSKQGWTTEAYLIEGEIRTNENDLQELMTQAGTVFLLYTSNDGTINGCVKLQQTGSRIHLGMLSVSPILQGAGTGKKILSAAEEYAVNIDCYCIYMSVISVRIELIGWYLRRGYRDTGERKPFLEDGYSGKHRQPLEFMILEKRLIKRN